MGSQSSQDISCDIKAKIDHGLITHWLNAVAKGDATFICPVERDPVRLRTALCYGVPMLVFKSNLGSLNVKIIFLLHIKIRLF